MKRNRVHIVAAARFQAFGVPKFQPAVHMGVLPYKILQGSATEAARGTLRSILRVLAKNNDASLIEPVILPNHSMGATRPCRVRYTPAATFLPLGLEPVPRLPPRCVAASQVSGGKHAQAKLPVRNAT